LAIGNFDYSGGFRFASSNVKTYAGEYPSQYEAKPGDLMIVMTCQTSGGEILGVPGRVPDDGRTYLHNQRIGKVVIDRPDLLDRDYFYHWAKTQHFNRQLFVTATGTKILHTSPGRVGEAEIDLPDIRVQRAIAEVLGALDDKIAANNRVVTAADDLARIQYKHALGDGASVPLSSLARFVNGRAYTKNATGTGRMVVRIAELNSGVGGSTVYNDIEVPDDNLARPGDLLFAWSGSLTAARWYRPEAIVNQHIFKVIPQGDVPMWLVNQAVHAKLEEFRAIAADKATTMGHIQRRHLDEPVVVPSSEEVARLSPLMTGLWSSALSAEMENERLAATRDELLPLLMSGKVTVKDAERTVSEAV